MDNWIKTTRQVLHGEDYFPALAGRRRRAGAGLHQFAAAAAATACCSCTCCRSLSSGRTIDLSAAYFVPDELTMQALLGAMDRGVRVRIITPGKHIDTEVVRRASRASWEALLEAGAEIYEYQPTMFHCKALIVDGLLVSVGSTNFDNRSFRLNDEANLNIYDAGFAREVTEVFEQDLQRAKRITLRDWKERPLSERTMERLSALFASQL